MSDGEIFYISALFLPSNLYRSIDKYVYHFEQLASTGIKIGLYLDPLLTHLGEYLSKVYNNVIILDYLKFDDSFVNTVNVQLPNNRNTKKDTTEYMLIQLMKLNCMSRASNDDRINTQFIAWIDFGVFHMFKNIKKLQEIFRELKFNDKLLRTKIYAPGCWNIQFINLIKGYGRDVWNNIFWRFSGSFLIGSRDLFTLAYRTQQKYVISNLPKLTWEVNYWIFLDDIFEWYEGNHDDSLIEGFNKLLR